MSDTPGGLLRRYRGGSIGLRPFRRGYRGSVAERSLAHEEELRWRVKVRGEWRFVNV